jgi:hypothetical protein
MAALLLIRYSAAFVSASFVTHSRAVFEFGSVRFVECWEFYRLPVHEKEIPEIERHSPVSCYCLSKLVAIARHCF